jgi:Doubled CXXCH motif (Paired_CXXCH_1)
VKHTAWLVVAVSTLACHGPAETPSMRQTVERAQAPNPNAGLSSEPYLDGAARVEVDGYADQPRFFVLARTPGIQKYPCTTCHTKPLAEMRGGGARKRAHWDVAMQHAPAAVMTCTTCHASSDLDTLRMLQGATVAFDHSYRVCAQCHARQARDWAGGAHGKRAGGWAPPRAVAGCPACHDPHRPAWQTRWPAVAVGQMRSGGGP